MAAAIFTAAALVCAPTFGADGDSVFKLGIIGATTSHVPAFVKTINAPDGAEIFKKFEVTALYPGGMPDNPDSWDRVEKYTQECIAAGLTVYGTIEEMLENVDGVLLESVDGRPHLEQVKPVIAAKKPVFIDKPMAGSLSDVLTIFKLAKENDVPVFSASSLRYVQMYQKMRNESPLGEIYGADATSPCSVNPKHPSLYWYGIHGVESLFTIMGPDCQSVARFNSPSADVVVGIWKGRKIGTFRGIRKGSAPYGAKVYCEKGVEVGGKYEGYEPLLVEICKFFETGVAPVDPQETINMFAFMSAADVSRKEKGATIQLADVLEAAENEKQKTATIKLTAKSEVVWNCDGEEKVFELETLHDLSETVSELKSGDDCDVVRVIIDNTAAIPIDFVQKVIAELDEAYLANYIY
ncbi:MAG: Gfo/Idh/MocA family oxidoreductase [Thermoguttaceae bacterium]|nr:Gfo/Idh/MocA family oxidoreductase [Thermoguttaceae bacterium]